MRPSILRLLKRTILRVIPAVLLLEAVVVVTIYGHRALPAARSRRR